MRVARPALLLLCLAAATVGCKSSDPNEIRPRLKNYLTERMRKQKFANIRTDEDGRARKPTKYAEATKGLAYALRHTAKFEETPVVIGTWVYTGKSERNLVWKGPFNAIKDDLTKEQREWKAWPVSFESPELHMILLMDAPEQAVENQLQLLEKLIESDVAELPTTPS